MIDVAPFCETDEEHWMHNAWLEGDKIIATDSRVLIIASAHQVKGSSDVAPWQERRAVPDWRQIMKGIEEVLDWHSLPEFPDCESCKGTARQMVKCDCVLGFVQCYACGHSHDCEDCDGSGWYEGDCHDCRPEILGIPFYRSVANRLLPLPSVEVARSSQDGCLFFRCDGAVGAVMGRVLADD